MSELSDELALPAYAGKTAAEAADMLNAKNIPVLVPISSHDIKEYLMVRGLWLPIKKSTSDAAEMAIDALDHFESFDINDPYVIGALNSIMDALVAETTAPDFIQANKDDIMAMGNSFVSRAEQLGVRVDTSTLQRMGVNNG